MSSLGEEVKDWLVAIAVAVVLAFVIRQFIVELYVVDGPSMRPTLQSRERLVVNKFIYRMREPERGEIIVFRYPRDPSRDFIKRVIAVPGDTIEIREGRVLVNDQLLTEDYILEKTRSEYPKSTVPEGRIFVTGNTVIDALHHTVRPDYVLPAELRGVDFADHRVLLVTTHRRENLGEPMRHVYRAIRDIIEELGDVEVIFPVHRNPKVREIVREELGGLERVHLIDPLDYEPFANLMARVDIVLTDSGGIQEEAPSLGKPVLVLRDTTERPEAVAAGTVRLIGTDEQRVYEETMRLLTEPTAYTHMAEAVNPYGDGEASRRIIEAILYHAGHAQTPPEPFQSA